MRDYFIEELEAEFEDYIVSQNLTPEQIREEHRQLCAAFDYDRQCWVNGAEAVELRRRQIRETLELLEGPQGEDFARFERGNREQMIEGLRRELETLGA